MAVGISAVARTVVATAGDASGVDASLVALLSVVSRWRAGVRVAWLSAASPGEANVLEGAYLEPVIR